MNDQPADWDAYERQVNDAMAAAGRAGMTVQEALRRFGLQQASPERFMFDRVSDAVWLREIAERPEAVARLLSYSVTCGDLGVDESGFVWQGARRGGGTTFRVSQASLDELNTARRG